MAAQSNEETGASGTTSDGASGERSMYARFGLMILVAMLVMFALTYTNSYSVDHVRWSEERAYMALLMGGAMAVVMLAFMWSMYKNVKVNLGILATGAIVMAVAFGLSQSQVFVEDEAYMRGMIPHHSIAIMTSERAGIEDVRVRDLAERISRAQKREIKEMNWLLEDIAQRGLATTKAEAGQRPVPDFDAE